MTSRVLMSERQRRVRLHGRRADRSLCCCWWIARGRRSIHERLFELGHRLVRCLRESRRSTRLPQLELSVPHCESDLDHAICDNCCCSVLLTIQFSHDYFHICFLIYHLFHIQRMQAPPPRPVQPLHGGRTRATPEAPGTPVREARCVRAGSGEVRAGSQRVA